MKFYTMDELVQKEILRLENAKLKIQKKIDIHECAPSELCRLWDKFNEMSNDDRIKNCEWMAKKEKEIKSRLKYSGDRMKDYDLLIEIKLKIEEWKNHLAWGKFRREKCQ